MNDVQQSINLYMSVFFSLLIRVYTCVVSKKKVTLSGPLEAGGDFHLTFAPYS
jgi:hypothetical protein